MQRVALESSGSASFRALVLTEAESRAGLNPLSVPEGKGVSSGVDGTAPPEGISLWLAARSHLVPAKLYPLLFPAGGGHALVLGAVCTGGQENRLGW